jgi:hypothetical protein
MMLDKLGLHGMMKYLGAKEEPQINPAALLLQYSLVWVPTVLS